MGENILSPKTIDIGIAAQVADGVMVPVLRRVNERTMEELLEDYNRLIAQARRRRLAPEGMLRMVMSREGLLHERLAPQNAESRRRCGKRP